MPKNQKQQLDKFAIAAALQEIAALMELKGGQNRFKAKAYNAGARSIQGVGNLDQLIQTDRLTSLPRIGNTLAAQIKELYLTGESSVLNNLRGELPSGVVELSGVPGLSVSRIKELQEQLGITTIDGLKAAAEGGRLRKLKGFGAKTEQRILDSIESRERKPAKRLHLHHALATGAQVIEYLQGLDGLQEVTFAGSLRRSKETIGVIDIVASAKEPSFLIQQFLRFPIIVSSQLNGATGCTAQLVDGAVVSLTATTPEGFIETLFSRTGSQAHLEKIERYAATNDSGLLPSNSRKTRASKGTPRTEAEIYKHFNMQYVPPELREDEGEIEAALAGELPNDLITQADIQGMVHCHTTYSDGKHSIEQMALAADAMGMKYLTITDHSPTAYYAGGVSIDRLKRQWDEIDEVQERVKVRLLRGTESDIVASGRLDYPDRILEKLDVIVASIHSRYKMGSKEMTERIINAMRLPVFKIWGHALGRLIERRPPFECDVERILDVVAESRAAIEINGDPYRLDLEPRWVREARKRKIKFVISVDAHSVGAMNNLQFGVGMARRGWVRRREVLNALGAKTFINAVRPV